jgi:hypothetical protein
MKRSLVRPSVAATTVATVIWMASACTIEDRTVDTDCYEKEGCLGGDPDGGGSGGSGSGGEDSSGGTTPGSGGKSSGGTGSGGKASGGTTPGSGGKASGGTSPGSGGSGGTETLDAAMLRFAEANCFLADACAQFFVAVSFGDQAGCVERTVLANEWYASLPGSTWNAAFFGRCADAWEAEIDDKNCSAFYATLPPAGCRSPGTRANGQPCNAPNQCSSNYCRTEGYDCGTCAPQPASGIACEINADCREDELCELDTGTCAKPLPLGAPCGPATADCVAPLSCHLGTCVSSPYEVGDACDAANGLFCDRTYGVNCNGTQCVTIPSAAVGKACPQGTFCLDGGYCSAGTCVAGPESSDPCDPEQGINCKWPAICIGPTSGAWCELPQDAVLCGSTG